MIIEVHSLMIIFEFVIYVFTGAFAGFLSGLLGIGGGLVTVPVLLYTFHLLGFPSQYSMQVAVGTSLGAMVFTSSSSAFSHYLKKGVYWHLFRVLAPAVLCGAFLGAFIVDLLPSQTLQLFFGFWVTLFGLYFLLSSDQKFIDEGKIISSPRSLILVSVGVVIGTLSTILGIGGGIFMVPFLTTYKVPLRNAISTSAVTGCLIAMMGGVAFLYFGLDQETFSGSIGYLYIPAFLIIGVFSSLTAPYGATLTYTLPTNILRRIFGVYLIIVGMMITTRT